MYPSQVVAQINNYYFQQAFDSFRLVPKELTQEAVNPYILAPT